MSLAADASIAVQAEELARRWTAKYLPTAPLERTKLDDRVQKFLKKLGPEGRFTDLTYLPAIGKGHGTGWGIHLIRVVDLMTAWRWEGSRWYGDDQLASRSLQAMDAYVAVPYDLKDIWGYGHTYADLFETNRIGRICLFARHDPRAFPQATIDRWCDRLPPCSDVYPVLDAGANLLWTAYGEIAGALARGDEARRQKDLDRFFTRIWTSMLKREGRQANGGCPRLTVDHMLGEHDMPAMGAYGEWYLNDVLEFRRITAGVPRWAMPTEVHRLWVDVLLDGVAHCYQGAIDPQLVTPLYWLGGRRNGNSVLRTWLTNFQDGEYRAAEIAAILAWEPGTTSWPMTERSVAAFPTIEYLSKHFPRWAWSMRAVSERTKGAETFAQKDCHRSIESVLLPYGTAFLRRDTRELQENSKGQNGIFDVYDFGRPTGMTTRHVDGAALAAAWNRDAEGFAVRSVRGSAPFVGIAAAAHTAVYGWWQAREVTLEKGHGMPGKRTDLLPSGRRAAFVLEDAVVNLGAGFDIRHDTVPTFTSVEQRLAAKNATCSFRGYDVTLITPTNGPEEKIWKLHGKTSIWYDEVGYLPPADGETTVQIQDQAGRSEEVWKADADGVKKPHRITPPSRQVFSIYTDHGRTNPDLAFDWALVPGISAEALPAYAANRPWRILANTTKLQAITVPTQRWTGAVFHVAGTLPGTADSDRPTLTVDRPVVLLAERQGTRLRMAAADPLGKAGDLHVTIDGTRLALTFPEGVWQGATAVLEVEQVAGRWVRVP